MATKTNLRSSETKEQETVTKKTSVTKKQAIVYLGPSMPGLMHGTILKTLNPEAKKLQENRPESRQLFVTPDRVAATRRELQNKGALRDIFEAIRGE